MKKYSMRIRSRFINVIVLLVVFSGCTMDTPLANTKEQCATPTFSPKGGYYVNDQSVTISCETDNATIYYTTDDTDPTTSDTRFPGLSPVGPIDIAVKPGITIRAIAAADGYLTSDEVSDVYESPYEIGDTGPAGGIIAYIVQDDSINWIYLEVAPPSTTWSDKVWGGYGTYVGTSSNSARRLGKGKSNTIKIVNKYGSAEPYANKSNYAARLCSNLEYGGYSDWFLPSYWELMSIADNLGSAGLVDFYSDWYWSSSEIDAAINHPGYCAEVVSIMYGITNTLHKSDRCSVIAARYIDEAYFC